MLADDSQFTDSKRNQLWFWGQPKNMSQDIAGFYTLGSAYEAMTETFRANDNCHMDRWVYVSET
jgi:hypothetical protein